MVHRGLEDPFGQPIPLYQWWCEDGGHKMGPFAPQDLELQAVVDPSAADLFRRLAPEKDESAVLSALIVERESRFALMQASLLIGPSSMGAGNWTEWQEFHNVRGPRLTEPSSARYLLRAEGARLVRLPLDLDHAQKWLEELLTTGTALSVDGLPTIDGTLQSANSPIIVAPNGGSLASAHAGRAVRAGDGALYSLSAIPVDLATIPTIWKNDDGAHYASIGGLVTGLYWPNKLEEQSPGLLVARLYRRAWIVEPRGTPDPTVHDLHIGLDPSRIDISDLEVQIEESVSGEIVHGRRLRLEEMGVDHTRGHPLITVTLPTLGRGVQRMIRLYERNGELLDVTENAYSLESIRVTVNIIGDLAAEPPGGGINAVPFRERAEALDRVQEQYADWSREGTAKLVFGPQDDLRTTLVSRLGQARGRLLVADRYFADWTALDGIPLPKRVLMSQGDPPVNPSADLEVRWLRGSPPTLHGRYYLWDGGGLFVDNSPAGFAHGYTTIQAMNRFTSERLSEIFNTTWWPASKASPPQTTPSPGRLKVWLRQGEKKALPILRRWRHLRNKVVGRTRGRIHKWRQRSSNR